MGRRDAWRRLGGRAAALALSLLVVEGIVRLALSLDPVFDRVRGQDDVSWRLAWLREGGQPPTEASVFEHHDVLGWVPRRGLDRHPADGYTVSTTALGARGRVPLELARRDRDRIVLLGDSFVFGAEVDDAATLDARLRALDPDREVINLGVSGYGHDQILLRWREHGRALDPDIVVLGYVDVDTVRNTLSFRDAAKPRFVLDGDTLTLEGVPVPSPRSMLWRLRLRPRTLDLLSLVRSRWAEPEPSLESESLDSPSRTLASAILERLIAEVRAAGAEPVVVYLPIRQEIEGPRPVSDGEAFLQAFCDAQDLECRSSRPALKAARNAGTPVIVRQHFNAEGNRIVAETVHALVAELAP